jgi:hypothetical protein
MDARRCLYSSAGCLAALLERAVAIAKDFGDIVRGKVRLAFDPLVIYGSKIHGLVQV